MIVNASYIMLYRILCLSKDIEKGETIDWATAEALAFGTLLLEGNHVRSLALKP